jgi:hypothetical protein
VQKLGDQLSKVEEGVFKIKAMGISLFTIALFETSVMCLQFCKLCCFRFCRFSTYVFLPVYIGLLAGILSASKDKWMDLKNFDESIINYAV